MPKLEPYDKSLDYTYVLGTYPSHAALDARPKDALRLLIGEDTPTDGVKSLIHRCDSLGVRVEPAARILRRESKKDNCHAALVVRKYTSALESCASHVVLHSISDAGNFGTCLRSCLGFGITHIAVIRPCVDIFEPHALRASMGASFAMNIATYDNFNAYRMDFPRHTLYPFMLSASATPLSRVRFTSPASLIFGNEGAGLPPSFVDYGTPVIIPHAPAIDSLNLSSAVSIAAYVFTREGVAT